MAKTKTKKAATKKAAAKSKAATKTAAKSKSGKPAGKLEGKTVAMVGTFGYKDLQRDRFKQHIADEGGRVIKIGKTAPDYLFVGEGRGGKPPGEAAQLQKQFPEMQALDLKAFARLLMPEPEGLLWRIAHRTQLDDWFWDKLDLLGRESGAKIDLAGADLRKATASGVHLFAVDVSGADFRGADVTYAHFPPRLKGANFEGCNGKNVYFENLEDCKFRGADLEKVWMFHDDGKIVTRCDFTGAQIATGRLERGAVTDCCFAGADLQDAECEGTRFQKVDFTGADLSRLHAHRAKFTEAVFHKANLTRADLRKASLAGADLRGANLREAILSEADLNGADVAGADLQDAVLTGAKLNGVDLSQAKNYRPPVVRKAGPKLKELAAAAKGAKEFETSAEVDLGKDEFAALRLTMSRGRLEAWSAYQRDGNEANDDIAAPTFEQGILGLAGRWPKCTLRLDSVTAKGSPTLRGQKLKELAQAAWAEAFGIESQSAEELKAGSAAQQAQALRERDDLMQKIRTKGGQVWNDLDYRLRDRIDLTGADFSGAKLDQIYLDRRELKRINLAGSSLVGGNFSFSKLPGAIFTGADLTEADLEETDLIGANFRDAKLRKAEMTRCKLQGADFTGADLQGAKLERAQFDHKTLFPAGFKPSAHMIWKGDGPPPGSGAKKAPAKAGSLDFDKFLRRLEYNLDPSRMAKARSMLKAEKFQLFADVKDDSLVGIVKSQTDKDLVYSCRLTNQGAFSCCTQNLRPCGGLHGALCKHLLVLIVGLAKSGQLDCATVVHWIGLSLRRKPAIDEDLMSATFLRYKDAEAGEVDWRPTETIPEDFYAM